MKQGELFKDLASKLSEAEQERESAPQTEEKFELRFTADKIIFVALAGLILLIVVFTFGVEHGKRLQSELSQNQREIESISNLARISAAKKALSQKQREETGKLLDRQISAIEGEAQTVSEVPQPKAAKPRAKFNIFRLFGLTGRSQKVAPAPKAESAISEVPEVVVSVPPANVNNVQTSPKVNTVPLNEMLPEPKVVAPAVVASPANGQVISKGYEVRILSVVEKKYADIEIERLNKNGIQASVRKSGNYYLVALGPYVSRQEADAAIKRVKSAGPFKDAYIRRLS